MIELYDDVIDIIISFFLIVKNLQFVKNILWILEKIPEKSREEAILSFYVEGTGYDNGTTCNMYISYYEEKTEEDLARERAQAEEYKRQVRERDLKTIEELKRKHGLC